MKIKKLLAVVLLIITLLSSVTFLDVINVKASGNYTLAQLQAKYPNGKYWNGGNPESYTSTPCNHHGKGICTYSGSCGCNSYRGLASQCMGFAYQLASLVYGGNPYSEWTANRNVSALDSVKPGDVIRYNNNGHSIFVTNVSGDVITYADCNGGGLNNCLIAWNRTKTKSEIKKTFSYVDQAPYAWENNSTSGTTNVNITSCPDKNTITNTNAILWGQVNKPSSYAVTQIGIKIRKSDSTYDNGWSKYEAPSWDYVGEPIVQPYYNLNTELSLTLSPGTDYYYKIYAKVNGTEYWSTETKFTTTGSHSHGYPSSWTTVTAPTCTTDGIAQRVCSTCGNTETKTLPATGHGFYSGYEAVHPHKYYQKCNCGYYYYTGEHQFLDTCNSCIDTTLVKLEKYNNHTYEIYDINISWERAKEFCEQKGGHLVTITTQEELDFLNELTLYQDTWLGGYLDTDSSWKWVTGEKFKFTSWNIGEPNNSWGIEKYVGTHNEGGWNDFSVSDTHIIYFACEYEPIPLKGDVDNNGEINSLDLTNLRIALFANNTNSLDNIACDINGDGKFDIIDLVRLKKKLAGIVA